MRKIEFVLSALLLILLLAACAPVAAPAAAAAPAAPAAPAAAAPAKARAAWEIEWEETVARAKKEGRLIISITSGPEIRAALAQGLRDAYGVAFEGISGRGAEVNERVITEQRAGLYNFDTYMGGSTTVLNQLKPAGALAPLASVPILPQVTDPQLWYGGEFPWLDKDRTSISFLSNLDAPLAINTNLVKPGDIKSYRDLLQPKWKGKIILNDPTVAGAGQNVTMFPYYVLGWDYVVELAKMEPTIVRDQRLMMDWLAQGKYAVVFPPKPDILTTFVRAGAPVKGLVPVEGTWVAGKQLSIVRNAPHPNAAKLFVNWLLTKEGQTIYSRVGGVQSGREDVPTDHLPPESVRKPGAKYFIKEKEEIVLAQPEIMRKAKEIFAPLMQK